MKLLRMTPGQGDVLLAEGDPELDEDAERLIAEFRRQLELGMWAAVPRSGEAGRREATLVRDFAEIPSGADRVIFFPRAAGGSEPERRARELLRSVAGDAVAETYERLGFVGIEGADYGYLLYPHRPIVAYDARSGELLSEFCVKFPDGAGAAEESLPDADDVLAKWLALQGDERRLIGESNLDPVGRQLDPDMVRRDLAEWRRETA